MIQNPNETINRSCENYFYSSFASFKNDKITRFKDFSILQLNVGGINNVKKFDRFKIMLSEMKTKSDIIVLGETKLKASFPVNLYHLNGYKMISCSRLSKHSGGGLLVYLRKEILVTSTVKSSSTHEKIKLNLSIEGNEITLLCYYRQPLSSTLKPFVKDIEHEVSKTNSKLIIVGDVNINAKQELSDTNEYVNMLASYDVNIMNSYQTRNVSGRLIDHFATNISHSSSLRNFTITNSLSDHNIIITQIRNWKISNIPHTISFRRTNFKALRNHFRSLATASNMLDIQAPNDISIALTNAIKTAINQSSKIVRYKIKSHQKVCKWFNEKVIKAIKSKDSAVRKWRKNKKNVLLKTKMRIATRKMEIVIRNEKTKYITRCTDTKDPKKLWRSLNEILGRSNKESISFLKIEGQIEQNEGTIAECFNNYFVNSVRQLSSEVNKSFHPPNFTTVSSSMFLEKPDESEIFSVINSLRRSAAPGIDGITAAHLKELGELIVPYLSHLINRIFDTGSFPDNLKVAVVIPINKSGDTSNVADFRPVSILSTISKIIEKLIHARLIIYTNEHLNLIYPYQFGFRSRCNAEIAALELIECIQSAIDCKKKVSAVFMDIKRAFDSVNVDILLTSLDHLGIRGITLELIKNFLINRSQVVRINETYSTPISFTQGVVQGSILGPWLFVLFFNHISDLKLNGKIFLYADDCVLLNFHDKNETVDTKIKSDMKLVINFLNYQELVLNDTKTFYMIFNSLRSKITEDDIITIKEEETDVFKLAGIYTIKRTNNFKYLGLILDESLNFVEHIKHIEQKASSASGILWKLRHQFPQSIKKRIYQSLFESHLTYMIIVWGNATDEATKRLQVIQNRALRNVFNLDRLLNRIDMYENNVENCLPIRGLFFSKISTLIFSILHKKVHSNIILDNSSDSRTREKNYLKLAKVKSLYGRKSIKFMGVKIFNDLPCEVKNSKHVYSFRRSVNAFIHDSRIQICLSNQFLLNFT